MMEKVGNAKANAYWEKNLPKDYVRPNTEDRAGMEKFITMKYVMRKWADTEVAAPNELILDPNAKPFKRNTPPPAPAPEPMPQRPPNPQMNPYYQESPRRPQEHRMIDVDPNQNASEAFVCMPFPDQNSKSKPPPQQFQQPQDRQHEKKKNDPDQPSKAEKLFSDVKKGFMGFVQKIKESVDKDDKYDNAEPRESTQKEKKHVSDFFKSHDKENKGEQPQKQQKPQQNKPIKGNQPPQKKPATDLFEMDGIEFVDNEPEQEPPIEPRTKPAPPPESYRKEQKTSGDLFDNPDIEVQESSDNNLLENDSTDNNPSNGSNKQNSFDPFAAPVKPLQNDSNDPFGAPLPQGNDAFGTPSTQPKSILKKEKPKQENDIFGLLGDSETSQEPPQKQETKNDDVFALLGDTKPSQPQTFDPFANIPSQTPSEPTKPAERKASFDPFANPGKQNPSTDNLFDQKSTNKKSDFTPIKSQNNDVFDLLGDSSQQKKGDFTPIKSQQRPKEFIPSPANSVDIFAAPPANQSADPFANPGPSSYLFAKSSPSADLFGQPAKTKTQNNFADDLFGQPSNPPNNPFANAAKPSNASNDPFANPPKSSVPQSFNDPFANPQNAAKSTDIFGNKAAPTNQMNDPFASPQKAAPSTDIFGNSQKQTNPVNVMNDPFANPPKNIKPTPIANDPFGIPQKPQQNQPKTMANGPFAHTRPQNNTRDLFGPPQQQIPRQQGYSMAKDVFSAKPQQQNQQQQPKKEEKPRDPFAGLA